MCTNDEKALLLRAVTGDEQALSALLAIHAPGVRARLCLGTQWDSKFDLDDVMQVTFLEAFLDIEHFNANGNGSFDGWLLSIAQNNLRDLIREAGRAKRPTSARQVSGRCRDGSCLMLIDALSDGSEAPSHHMRAEEACQILEHAIQHLPGIYASVVRLYDLEGRPAAEVAAELGRSTGAVFMLRARAHGRLRLHLGSESRFFSHRA